MSEVLKPCPFCKYDALIVTDIHHRHGTKIYHGECNVCGAESKACDSKEEAIKAWNTRPAEDALKAEVEELRYIVNEFKEWYNEHGCPKYLDSNFPCNAETEYKNDPETEGDFDEWDCWKQEHEAGCWVEYYRWKYKQEKEKGGKDDTYRID